MFGRIGRMIRNSRAWLQTCYWRSMPRRRWLRRLMIGCVLSGIIVVAGMYSIAVWYMWTERHQPLTLGTSFVADYATYLGLDPHQTFRALLDDLHVRQFRLVSYWSDIEPSPGTFDFSELDWELQQVNEYHGKVSLAIGLRQPRWPECHMPTWAQTEPASVWQPQLDAFMTAVINRYKDNPALESYQLENEFFLSAFATCPGQTRARLVEEAALVRRLDPAHTLIISRSQNAIGWPVGQPHADEYGISIYQRVWTPMFGRYIQYPFPAWYYAFLAGMEKLWSGKDTMIHELQAEPWPPKQQTILNTSLSEQSKSFDAQRLQQTVAFGKATGMKTIDLWGAEYWYYRKVTLHDPSVWDTARHLLAQNQT